jgi:tRNA(Ile)-lysidine synthase
MANSRKSNSANFTDRVAAQIAPLLPAHSSILIGLSGGVDSVALLHVLHTLAVRFCWKLSAVHVHHGISPHADAWAAFCADLCTTHHIPLHIEKVDITPLRAQGIEAAARQLRHAAFASQPCDVVALAHHADDQAETLLLQLLRGAGVRGASSMPIISAVPFISERTGLPRLIRPLLRFSRQEILDYAAAHELQWIEDESNADDNYPRNFLRHRVLPLLGEKFPAYRDTLARSAQHFAEASGLLDELAQLDAAPAIEGETLAVAALQALSPPRAKNLLRYFLHGCGAPIPQTVQLDDMLLQLCHARQDALVCIAYSGWQVRRYHGRIYALRALDEFDSNLLLPWHGEAELPWPALNARLQFKPSQAVGISVVKLQRAPVTIRLRQGGETLRPHPNATTRTVKNLLQEHHVPPWQRERLPLLYCGTDLVYVAGVAVAAEYQAVAGEAGISMVYS